MYGYIAALLYDCTNVWIYIAVLLYDGMKYGYIDLLLYYCMNVWIFNSIAILQYEYMDI